MLRSLWLLLCLFVATAVVAENDASFDIAQQAFFNADYEKAEIGFTQAARQGSADADYYLGLIAKNFVEKPNYQTAMQHFISAAKSNHAQAMWELGILYENGEGVVQDQFTAMDWFRKSEAATEKAEFLSFYLADKSGELIEATVPEYLEYLIKQANDGSTDAKFALAKIYDAGAIVAADMQEAFDWYLSAAKDGHAKAAQLVSYFYCRGIAVPRDVKKANSWVKTSGYSTTCN